MNFTGSPSNQWNRFSQKQQIYLSIREQIQNLALAPGQVVVESTLCEAMNVSRTPIREALMQLSNEGLIDIYPQRGTYISRIDVNLVRELVYMRNAIETNVFCDLCRSKPAIADAVSPLIAMQQTAADENDYLGYLKFDDEFHSTIYQKAGHIGLWNIIEDARIVQKRYRMLHVKLENSMNAAIDVHKQIVVALENADEPSLCKLLYLHHNNELNKSAELIAAYPDFFTE